MLTPEAFLGSLGYRHARVHHVTLEDERVVVLFTVPHAQRRRALTAFIARKQGRPDVEVEPGFVIEQGRGK